MHIKIKDVVWPLPNGDLEWRLRYATEISEVDRMRAASILAAYAQMIRDTTEKRQMVVREIRKAVKATP